MVFPTIHDLVGDTRGKINKLNGILDVLLANFRSASEIIEPAGDSRVRQMYLDQLFELNKAIGEIVDTHPANRVDILWRDVIKDIKTLASENPSTKATI